jgi:hypothetical protein
MRRAIHVGADIPAVQRSSEGGPETVCSRPARLRIFPRILVGVEASGRRFCRAHFLVGRLVRHEALSRHPAGEIIFNRSQKTVGIRPNLRLSDNPDVRRLSRRGGVCCSGARAESSPTPLCWQAARRLQIPCASALGRRGSTPCNF